MRSECAWCVLRTARRLVCLEPREKVGRGREMRRQALPRH